MRKTASHLLVVATLVLFAPVSNTRAGALSSQQDSPSSLAAAAGEFAQQILARTGPLAAVAVSFQNTSSLAPESQEAVQNGVFTVFRNANVRLVKAEQAQAEIDINLSENWQSYVWIATIRQGPRSQVVMKQTPRSERAPAPRAPALTIRKNVVWQQDSPVLDFYHDKDHLVVLEPDQVAIYSQDGEQWRLRYTLGVTHPGAWPRDLRGRLQVNGAQVTAFLPGLRCTGGSSPPSLDCHASDDPWPVDHGAVVAFYSARRNFFTGLLAGPSAGASVISFFSAAAWQNGDARQWLFTGIDGRTRLYQYELTAPVAVFNAWGSNVAAVHSNCGAGWQVLVTAPTDSLHPDSVHAVEIVDRGALPVSSPVELSGPVEALWAAGKNGEQANGVMRSLTTGKYEAFILTVSCGQ